jgi:hypothetical protein
MVNAQYRLRSNVVVIFDDLGIMSGCHSGRWAKTDPERWKLSAVCIRIGALSQKPNESFLR